MEHVKLEIPNAIGDNSLVWVDQETLDGASVFSIEGGFDCAFTTGGSSNDWGDST